MDATRWAQLSPLLDELLELEAPLREQRLAQLQQSDAGLASDLRQLLAVERHSQDFIAEPLLGHHEQQALAGQRVGPYRLMEPLGEGGMGQVWLAVDERQPGGERVALKLLRADLADPHLRARFLRERDTLARLSHPQIPRLCCAGGEASEQFYLALEYIQGEAITRYCQRHALSPRRCVALFLHVCKALEYVHAQRIVHRDIKPSNILVDDGGCARLLDFGIARHLDEPPESRPEGEARAFTLHYAAPEQIRGEASQVAADVYSLGVVLYELLAGQKPYRLRRQSDAEWERAVLRAEVTPPSVMVRRPHDDCDQATLARRSERLRGTLDAIVLKALQKSADDRYPTVAALAEDLRRWQRGQAVATRPSLRTHPWLQWLRRLRPSPVTGV